MFLPLVNHSIEVSLAQRFYDTVLELTLIKPLLRW